MATLNVILHGTIVYRQIRDQDGRITGIQGLIPSFRDHVVKAGSFLAESQLRSNAFSLEGVRDEDPRPDVLDLSQNMVFPGRIRNGLRLRDGELYAQIDLKLPRSVRTMRRARVPRAMFEGDDGGRLRFDEMQIPNIQIFTYTIQRFQDLMLRDHPWIPVQGECVNLHIFAEHERVSYNAANEFAESFQAMVKLFEVEDGEGSRPLSLTLGETVPFTLLGDRPSCVSPEELEALSPRLARLERLGRLQTANTPALINQLWFDFDPADPEAPTCGSGTGDP